MDSADWPFLFFRGTALLYYRDYAGSDAHLPIVFTIGDAHPENFGVMPNADGAPFFGVNDFDEAWAAPFSYDVKRGAVGFWIAAKEERKKDRRRVVRAGSSPRTRSHLVGGDPLYGFAEIDDRSFLVRERSPFKDEIKVSDLDLDAVIEYAHVCGQALAQPHARSDAETGIMEGEAETRILSSIMPKLFCRDVVEFAEIAARRVYADHKMFRSDQRSGAFR